MVIPADWKELRIGEFCDANWGNTAITKSSYVNSGITAFSASGPDGFVSWHERIGDGIVLSAIGALCGKTWLAEGKWTPIKNTIWMQVQSPDFSTKYLYYATGDPKFWPSRGAAQPFIGLGDVRNLKVQLPPLKEQEAIAEALSDADAAIESLDALITKKRDVKQATMQQLLTGRTRLPGFNADWKEVRLGDLGVCLRGVSYKGDSDLSDGDTPKTVRLLRSNNVQNSLIQFNDVQYVNHDCVSDEQILRRDDIVICMANGSKVLVGKTGLYKDSQDARYTFGAFMGCFRSLSDQAHAIFVRYLFLTKQYQDYISNLLAGSSINNLTPKSIESLLFKVPPLKEQEAIAEALSVIDDELEELTKQVTKLRMVKEGMMQDLLTGKVRLV